MTITGAELLVRNLEAQDVRYVFGVPGAKIVRVYDALLDWSQELRGMFRKYCGK